MTVVRSLRSASCLAAKGTRQRCVSVCGGAAVPEAGSEVVAAGHKAGVGGRVDDAADDVVVSQRQQVFPLGRARVPAAQADGALVRQQDVVLRVVEHALRAMHLPAAQPRACNTQEKHVTRRGHCTANTTQFKSNQSQKPKYSSIINCQTYLSRTPALSQNFLRINNQNVCRFAMGILSNTKTLLRCFIHAFDGYIHDSMQKVEG